MRTLVAVLLLLFTAPAFAAPLRVVVSFSILADWVSVVGGNRVEVVSIVARNGDTHAFRPSPSDAKLIAGADLLIVNGLGFEGWLPRLIEASGYKGKIITASDGVHLLASRHTSLLAEEDTHGHDSHNRKDADPHAWHSLENAIHYVRNIQLGLSQRDPENSSYYLANADRYIAQLRILQGGYQTAFGAIPPGERKVVTAHDAFVYFADDYGVELLAPQSSSVGIGSSARRVAALVERIKRDNIRAVFLENVTDPRLLEQVSRETGIAVGGHLYSDALSDSDGEAATYLELMKHNLDAILNALTPDH